MQKITFSALFSCIVAAGVAGLLGTSTGCGDGGGGGGGGGGSGGGSANACYDYSKFDGTTPEASFKSDVLPILQRSCGVSMGCHGDPNAPDEKRPYLGPKQSVTATDMDIAIIRGGLIDVPSFWEPGMSLVKPSDPENSFLMHKMDFTLECSDLACADAKDCGTVMPQGNDKPLDIAERDTIRRWIAQGALDN